MARKKPSFSAEVEKRINETINETIAGYGGNVPDSWDLTIDYIRNDPRIDPSDGSIILRLYTYTGWIIITPSMLPHLIDMLHKVDADLKREAEKRDAKSKR